MKSFLPLLLSLCLLLSGCGGAEPHPQPVILQPALTELVDTLAEEYELPMPAILDDELMAGLLSADTRDMVQYRGYISMSSDSCDQIIGIEAKENKARALAAKLEARLSFVAEDAKSGPEQKLKRAQSGTVYQKNNYLFLIIAGRPNADPKTETDGIIKRIEDSFLKK